MINVNFHNGISAGNTITTNDFALSGQLSSVRLQIEINKIRKRLLWIVGILLTLDSIMFILNLLTYVTPSSHEYRSAEGISRLPLILFSIIYYGFGFYVAYRYFRTGVLVFAWLGLICLFILVAAIIIIIIEVTIITKPTVDAALIGRLVAVGFYSIVSLLEIFAIHYAFALSKLLEQTKPAINERV